MSNNQGKFSPSQKIFYVMFPCFDENKNYKEIIYKKNYFGVRKDSEVFFLQKLAEIRTSEDEELKNLTVSLWSCYIDGRSKKIVLLEALNNGLENVLLKKQKIKEFIA